MSKKIFANFFTDKDGRTVIGQAPNRWFWIGLFGWLFARSFEDSGLLEWLGWLVFSAGALPWAFLEITKGVNTWRKLLGWLVLFWATKLLIDRLLL